MLHTALSLEALIILSTLGIVVTVTPVCVDMTSRQEIRAVSAGDRARLLAEYKHQRRLMGSRRFTLAMASIQLCDIVNRIDRALAPKRMPYWNARWDLRLSRPADSVLFSEHFFSNIRVRRNEKRKKTRESFPRGLSTHFRRLNINASLTSAIRANRAAQLLVILYHLGQWKGDDGGCQACMTSLMAFCDIQKHECVSRMVATANCSEFSAFDPCYASKCMDGICQTNVKTSLAHFQNKPAARKKHAERAVTVKTIPATTTTTTTPSPTTVTTTKTTTSSSTTATTTTTDPDLYMDDVECMLIEDYEEQLFDLDSGAGTGNWSSTSNGTTSESSESIAETLKASDTSSVTSLKPLHIIPEILDHPRNFYDISPIDNHIFVETQTATSSTHTEAEVSRSTGFSQIEPPTAAEPSTTTASPRHDQPHFNHWLNTWVYPFNATLPFPSVYFSITVAAGPYRPRPRPQRSVAGVTVVSRGANLPSGYTHIVEALSVTDGHIVRVPDPITIGVGVEFFLTVLHNGQECERMCLSRRRYGQCKRPTVRLSRYRSLTDPVTYYKTPRQAIEHQWKGAGYFRRRTQDPFVFTCFI